MSRVIALSAAALLSVASPALAQQNTWTINSSHSSAQFTVRHMMVSNVHGQLGEVSGSVTYDGTNLTGLSVDASIDTAGLSTQNGSRDTHLKGPDFFDVTKYPTITFKSKRVQPGASGHFTLVGDLTMHGVTKEVTLDVEGPSAPVKVRDAMKMGATATTRISRKEFGLTWNSALEAGGVAVSDEVAITLELELDQKKG